MNIKNSYTLTTTSSRKERTETMTKNFKCLLLFLRSKEGAHYDFIEHDFVETDRYETNGVCFICHDKIVPGKVGLCGLQNNYGMSVVVIVITAVVLWYYFSSKTRSNKTAVRPFPHDFLFGVATSSYQIEGAWNEDGKSESVWDYLLHSNPSLVADGSNADSAVDSYHLYKRDVEMMRELGIDYYRFSLSWPRLLPTGFPDQINLAAVDFYNNYIDEMIKYNITPIVTLFHWDYPQKLLEMRGWSSSNISDWFVDYARTAFRLFGDRVKFWITMNEPEIFCTWLSNYGDLIFEKDFKFRVDVRELIKYYICIKNAYMIHARAWHVYDEEFRPSQAGNISIAISLPWFESENKHNTTNNEAADEINLLNLSILDPIFSEAGGFRPEFVQKWAAKSVAQGYVIETSRILFTDEEKKFVRGTSDYFGLIHYVSMFVRRKPINVNTSKSYLDMIGIEMYFSPEWDIGDIGGTNNLHYYTPRAFYQLLTKIREEFKNWPVFVLENGFATQPGLQDDARVTYLRGYLSAMLDAIDDGSDVRGYTVWSLMDTFEWFYGYTPRYGLYEVDFEDPARARRPRKSAFVYKHIVRTRTLDPYYEPDTDAMTIDDGH